MNDPSAEDDDSASESSDGVETSPGLVQKLAVEDESEDDDLAKSGAPPPFWRPHQPFGHFLYDAISLGGTSGMSTMVNILTLSKNLLTVF